MNDTAHLNGGQLPTRTQWAHDQLRSAILRGDYGPGDPLVISSLAREMGISATPLREALGNLAATGFIELQSHGKARVAEVALAEANEIYELRLMLEPVALKRAVHNADAGYRERVESAWRDLTVEQVAPPSVHAAFHRELLATCDSAWLLKMATMLADRAGLMIAVGIQRPPPGYNTAEVHRQLKDFAIEGDAEAAADELHSHLSKTIDAFRVIHESSNTHPKESE